MISRRTKATSAACSTRSTCAAATTTSSRATGRTLVVGRLHRLRPVRYGRGTAAHRAERLAVAAAEPAGDPTHCLHHAERQREDHVRRSGAALAGHQDLLDKSSDEQVLAAAGRPDGPNPTLPAWQQKLNPLTSSTTFSPGTTGCRCGGSGASTTARSRRCEITCRTEAPLPQSATSASTPPMPSTPSDARSRVRSRQTTSEGIRPGPAAGRLRRCQQQVLQRTGPAGGTRLRQALGSRPHQNLSVKVTGMITGQLTEPSGWLVRSRRAREGAHGHTPGKRQIGRGCRVICRCVPGEEQRQEPLLVLARRPRSRPDDHHARR